MDNIAKLEEILKQVCNKPVSITEQTDLYEDKILDSLDSMVFFMQIEEKLGITVPDDADLKAEGYYKVQKLLSLIK